MAKECKHKWGPFTAHKAECAKCGTKTPWLDLLSERQEMVEYWVRQLKQTLTERDRLQRVLAAVDSWAQRRPILPPWGS